MKKCVWMGGAAVLGAALASSGLRAVSPPNLPFPSFEDITKKAGIDFHLDAGEPLHAYILENNGAGVALIDYDNDGWPDIYFVNGSTSARLERHEPSRGNRLYHNNHDGTFTDVTAKAGVKGNGDWGMGACVGDVDNNGYDDLFVTSYGKDVLYLNNGDGTFRDATAESGLAEPKFPGDVHWHTGCAFGDYDRDGNLDLYVATYVNFSLEIANRESRFATPQARANPASYPGPTMYSPQLDEFYENVGGGRFVDASLKSGIRKVPAGNGFSVVWGDYNDDGYPDIYVANDLSPNNLFRNNGDKTFTEVGLAAGVALGSNRLPHAGMGIDMADYDNDGHLDIVTTNFSSDYTSLFKNDAKGGFTDVSNASGFPVSPFLGWGVQFVDLDLDGFQDLITVNGGVAPSVDTIPNLKEMLAGYFQRRLVYRNRRDGTFEEIGAGLGGVFTEVHGGRGLAVGDLNNDGQMDLVIANQDETPSVLINQAVPGSWALIKLRGTTSNRSAIGARVTLRAGGLTQIREVKSGGSFLSQSDLRVHFGLGSAGKIDDLQVRWPSGDVQIERNVPINRITTITEK